MCIRDSAAGAAAPAVVHSCPGGCTCWLLRGRRRLLPRPAGGALLPRLPGLVPPSPLGRSVPGCHR
eukprot:1113059-Alexandrium_andersonii.AAC.1